MYIYIFFKPLAKSRSLNLSPSPGKPESVTHSEVSDEGVLGAEKSIGLALVLGFTLMLLIDQIAGSHHKSG